MTPRARRPFAVGVLAYEGAQRAAVLGLRDLLAAAAQLHAQRSGEPPLEVHLIEVSALPDPREHPLRALALPPSLSPSPPGPPPPALAAWLHAHHSAGAVLSAVCAGVFLLAELGLLDGRPATTHWALGEAFTQRFPDVELDTDRILIDDGDLLTAGGMMAWTDLGLRLIGRLLGPSVLSETARIFLIDPGGRAQSFYRSFTPALTHGDEAVLRVQRWLPGALGRSGVTVEEMAAKAGLGRRTFLRRFQAATGLRTTEYVQQLRVHKARGLLEMSGKTQQEVAWAVGYEDAGAFRRVFTRWVGLSPVDYRRRFCSGVG